MTDAEYRTELYALLNRARDGVHAQALAEALVEATAKVVVLAESVMAAKNAEITLDGMVEGLRHFLDQCVVDFKVEYGTR